MNGPKFVNVEIFVYFKKKKGHFWLKRQTYSQCDRHKIRTFLTSC